MKQNQSYILTKRTEKGIHKKLTANICYYFKYPDENTSLSFQRNKYLSLQSRLIWMLNRNAGGMEMGYGETTFLSDNTQLSAHFNLYVEGLFETNQNLPLGRRTSWSTQSTIFTHTMFCKGDEFFRWCWEAKLKIMREGRNDKVFAWQPFRSRRLPCHTGTGSKCKSCNWRPPDLSS